MLQQISDGLDRKIMHEAWKGNNRDNANSEAGCIWDSIKNVILGRNFVGRIYYFCSYEGNMIILLVL